MGTVRRIAPSAGDVTLGQAAEAYLGTLGGAEQASTRRPMAGFSAGSWPSSAPRPRRTWGAGKEAVTEGEVAVGF